jgi:RNA polymerase sigma-54 factor
VRTQGAESDLSALDLIAADVGLRQYLHTQINVLPLEPRDHALACAIVESLDDDGYLRTPLEEIAATPGMPERSTPTRC